MKGGSIRIQKAEYNWGFNSSRSLLISKAFAENAAPRLHKGLSQQSFQRESHITLLCQLLPKAEMRHLSPSAKTEGKKHQLAQQPA